MEIKTNNQPRPIIYGSELTERERAEFDYYEPDDLESATFFRYKKQVYDLGEFIRIENSHPLHALNYHGMASDSFFSGIAIKLSDCGEAVTIARLYS